MNYFISPHCITVFVVNKNEARYLVIRRCGEYLKGTWQMVTGGILEGETAPQAALREVQEETGLVPTELYCADFIETFYLQNRDKIAFVPVFVAFVDKMEVQLSPKEHDAFEWLSFTETRERLVWSQQKKALQHIHETFILNTPHELLQVKL